MNTTEGPVHRLVVTHDNGQIVGVVSFTPSDDQWTFRYADEWQRHGTFQLSPVFPWFEPPSGYDSNAIRRFITNLFPEGAPLRAAIEQLRIAPGNAFALLRSMGGETTGALGFHAEGQPPASAHSEHRGLPRDELNERILSPTNTGLTVWDGRARMSIAGYQDKLAVYAAHDLVNDPEASMWLAEPPLASTHILKPQPQGGRTPHLVANEHFCMSLAAAHGAAVANVGIMRLPTPVLVVKRFDRELRADENSTWVRKRHVIDACQACDLPVELKYERLGETPDLSVYRDGMSLPKLYGLAPLMQRPALARLEMLRWVLFQLVIGNADAHGKNFSFFVRGTMLVPAPWYDIVCVERYQDLDRSFAMAIGDAFSWEGLNAMELAHFAHLCGIDKQLLRREALRLERAIAKAPELLNSSVYTDDERAFLRPISEMAQRRSHDLIALAQGAAVFSAEHF